MEYVKYTFSELFSIEQDALIDALCLHTEGIDYATCKTMPEHVEKIKSWIDCLNFFRRQPIDLDKMGDVPVCFEYKIFDGQWIDAVIVCKNKIIILEFKSGESKDPETLAKHRRQVNIYFNKVTRCNKNVWREIASNESFSVEKYLVYTKASMRGNVGDYDFIKVDNQFIDIIASIGDAATDARIETLLEFDEKLDSTTVGAMRKIICGELLSTMYRADDSVQACVDILQDTMNNHGQNELNLIFVKGAPGTGKTGVAFCVLEKYLAQGAKYVTGNGNLSAIFNQMMERDDIQGTQSAVVGSLHQLVDVIKFCQKYHDKTSSQYKDLFNKIVIIDEAQRIWNPMQIAFSNDNKKGKKPLPDEYKHFILQNEVSEAMMLLYSAFNTVLKDHETRTLVFLIGTGQEIYIGEENGEEYIEKAILHLNKYIQRTGKNVHMNVYSPDEETAKPYIDSGLSYSINEKLRLPENKRNPYNDAALEFVNGLVDEKPELIEANCAIAKDAFSVYHHFSDITDSINTDFNDLTYGILACGFDTEYDSSLSTGVLSVDSKKLININNSELYNFYIYRTCTQLDKFASQFNCQGLELDFPIVIWGNMMLRRNNEWKISDKYISSVTKYSNNVNAFLQKNPQLNIPRLNTNKIREMFIRNCYRVLLTRARYETFIYVEDEETYEYLRTIMNS